MHTPGRASLLLYSQVATLHCFWLIIFFKIFKASPIRTSDPISYLSQLFHLMWHLCDIKLTARTRAHHLCVVFFFARRNMSSVSCKTCTKQFRNNHVRTLHQCSESQCDYPTPRDWIKHDSIPVIFVMVLWSNHNHSTLLKYPEKWTSYNPWRQLCHTHIYFPVSLRN